MTLLLELHEEHPIAFERELISAGVRLRDFGTDRLNWRDLLVIISCARQDPASHLYRSIDPEASRWTAEAWLAAEVADRVAVLIWQNAQDPNNPKPERIERPGVVNKKDTSGHYGSDPIEQEAMAEWLGWN
jgi:hypothetical protein